MRSCRWEKRVEQWFDGRRISGVEEHVAACGACRKSLETLQLMRQGAERSRPGVSDAQFGAFYAGIRERAETPAPGHGRAWAFASLGLAALIAAGSTFAILSGGPRAATAETVVESYSTDLQDATVEYYRAEDGTATLQVHYTGGDMW